MTGGLRRYLVIVGTTWVASWIVTAQSRLYSKFGVDPFTWVEALPAALFVGTIAWMFARRNPIEKFSVFSPPVFWSIIVIGVLEWGRALNTFSQTGIQLEQSSLQAFIGMQGVLIAIGVLGLSLNRTRN